MSFLFYHLDQEYYKGKLFLVAEIDSDKDSLKKNLSQDILLDLSQRESDRKALLFLIKEELSFLSIPLYSPLAKKATFNRIRIQPSRVKEALKALGETGKIFYQKKKIVIDPFLALNLYYELEASGNGLKVEGRINKEENIKDYDWIFCGAISFGLKHGILRFFSDEVSSESLSFIYPTHLYLEGLEKDEFLERVAEEHSSLLPKIIWKGTPLIRSSIDPLPVLILKDRSGAFADLSMDYGSRGKLFYHDEIKTSWRKKEIEQYWQKDLIQTDFIEKVVGSSHYYCPTDKVAKSLSFLLQMGWEIRDYQNRRVCPEGEKAFSIALERDKMVVKGKFKYAEHEADLKDVIGAFNRRERFVELGKDMVGLIDKEGISTHFAEHGEFEIISHGIAFKKSHFGLLDSLINLDGVTCDQEVRKMASQLDLSSKIDSVSIGSQFSGNLHPYQQEGVNWLYFLYQYGFHGLLADEMGLGKTVQVLAFFSLLKRELPILVVMPTSLLFHWRKEIEKFLPAESVYIHRGKERFQEEEYLQKKGIILTSYPILRQDALLFQKLTFEAVILDEAQTIKNPLSQGAQAAFKLKANFRLSITGTPVENRLEELWSIFFFLIPDLLGALKEFTAKVASAQSDERFLKQIKKKVRPFLLRRRKDEVDIQLPEKQTQVIFVEMQEKQRSIYEGWLSMMKQGVIKKVEEEGIGKNRMEVLEAILRLRQICCHPLLVASKMETLPFQEEGEEATFLSAKLERLLADLEEVTSQNRKVLVYSQFTQMLHLIEKEVKNRGLSYVYLDGTTKDREATVEKFQTDDKVLIFLISLKAGGVGLNLTAADYVFLFDPWWNEAVEEQAIDRAHRLGRKGALIARRYITVFTIEEKMMHLKQKKSSLSQNILELEQNLDDLTLEQLLKGIDL